MEQPDEAGHRQLDTTQYEAAYACDGNLLELSCPSGKSIRLLRASYGRFSLSICNDHGHYDLNVQCATFIPFKIMETR